MKECPCGSGKEYDSCCGLYHSGKSKADAAEKLMRARYSAFVCGEIDYIEKTHVEGTKDFDKVEATNWAKNSEWLGLEIVKTEKGQAKDATGVVEFKAKFKDKESDKVLIHHEVARFVNSNGTWAYKEGEIVGLQPITRTEPKIGRNDPCHCGSGKKYKKCCGA